MALKRNKDKKREAAKKKVANLGVLEFKSQFPSMLEVTGKKDKKVKK